MSQRKVTSTSRTTRGYTSSDASRAAARANGAKSKGPLDPEARKAVGMHALKDGFTAETPVLENESQADFDSRVADFTAELRAESKIERYMARQVALASWRLDRVILADAATLDRQVSDAQRGNREQQARDVDALGQRLASSPAEVVSKLRETAVGCRYMLAKYIRIWRMLVGSDGIWRSEHVLAVNLLGKRVSEMSDTDVEDWCIAYLSTYLYKEQKVDLRLAHGLFDAYRPETMDEQEFADRLAHWISILPTREEGVRFMKTRVAKAIRELKARARALEAEEARRHGKDVRAAKSDGSLSGARRLGYEKEHRREFLKMVDAVKGMRKSRLAGVFDQPVTITIPPDLVGAGARAETEPGGEVESESESEEAEPRVELDRVETPEPASDSADPNWKQENKPKSEPAAEAISEIEQEVTAPIQPPPNPNPAPPANPIPIPVPTELPRSWPRGKYHPDVAGGTPPGFWRPPRRPGGLPPQFPIPRSQPPVPEARDGPPPARGSSDQFHPRDG